MEGLEHPHRLEARSQHAISLKSVRNPIGERCVDWQKDFTHEIRNGSMGVVAEPSAHGHWQKDDVAPMAAMGEPDPHSRVPWKTIHE
jgi:hypothetical protein